MRPLSSSLLSWKGCRFPQRHAWKPPSALPPPTSLRNPGVREEWKESKEPLPLALDDRFSPKPLEPAWRGKCEMGVTGEYVRLHLELWGDPGRQARSTGAPVPRAHRREMMLEDSFWPWWWSGRVWIDQSVICAPLMEPKGGVGEQTRSKFSDTLTTPPSRLTDRPAHIHVRLLTWLCSAPAPSALYTLPDQYNTPARNVWCYCLCIVSFLWLWKEQQYVNLKEMSDNVKKVTQGIKLRLNPRENRF